MKSNKGKERKKSKDELKDILVFKLYNQEEDIFYIVPKEYIYLHMFFKGKKFVESDTLQKIKEKYEKRRCVWIHNPMQ